MFGKLIRVFGIIVFVVSLGSFNAAPTYAVDTEQPGTGPGNALAPTIGWTTVSGQPQWYQFRYHPHAVGDEDSTSGAEEVIVSLEMENADSIRFEVQTQARLDEIAKQDFGERRLDSIGVGAERFRGHDEHGDAEFDDNRLVWVGSSGGIETFYVIVSGNGRYQLTVSGESLHFPQAALDAADAFKAMAQQPAIQTESLGLTVEQQPGGDDEFIVGDVAHTTAIVNLRRTIGYQAKPAGDVMMVLPLGTQVTILNNMPQITDNLTWWNTRATLANGTTIEGWLAESAPSGQRFIEKVAAGQIGGAPADIQTESLGLTVEQSIFPAELAVGTGAHNAMAPIVGWTTLSGQPHWYVFRYQPFTVDDEDQTGHPEEVVVSLEMKNAGSVRFEMQTPGRLREIASQDLGETRKGPVGIGSDRFRGHDDKGDSVFDESRLVWVGSSGGKETFYVVVQGNGMYRLNIAGTTLHFPEPSLDAADLFLAMTK